MKKIYKKKEKNHSTLSTGEIVSCTQLIDKKCAEGRNPLKISRAYTYTFLSIQNTEHLESVY